MVHPAVRKGRDQTTHPFRIAQPGSARHSRDAPLGGLQRIVRSPRSSRCRRQTGSYCWVPSGPQSLLLITTCGLAVGRVSGWARHRCSTFQGCAWLGGLGSLAEPHTMACVRWSGGSGFVPGLGVMVSVVLDLPACPPACRPACGWVSRYAPPAPHPPHAPDSPTARSAPAPPAPHPRSPAPPGPPPQPGPALRRVRIRPWSAMCVDGRCGGGRRRRHILRSVLQDHKIIELSASAGDQKVNTGGIT